MTQSDNYNYKIENEMFNLISHIKNGNYLEFGVREGRSTSKFLELCKKNNGKLLSVDIEDYSKLFVDKNWKFLNCRDDNFAQVDKNINKFFFSENPFDCIISRISIYYNMLIIFISLF